MYKKILVVVLLIFNGIVSGQNAADIDVPFLTNINAIKTINSEVFAMTLQSDGKILIGLGHFNTTNSSYIMRLNSDGTIDNSFLGPTTYGQVRNIKIQQDGKILVSLYPGINANGKGLVRLNSDGSIDQNFILTVTNSSLGCSDIAIQSDGKILVGGTFTVKKSGGALYNVNGLIRLNSDGTHDTSFVLQDTGFNGTVQQITPLSNGKILVAGDFTYYNGVERRGIHRLQKNGYSDDTFFIGIGFDGSKGLVKTIAVQKDDKILVGGSFNFFHGSNDYPKLIRLNVNGDFDGTFHAALGLGDVSVRTISIQTDNKILVGGLYTNIFERLNTNGNLDSSLNVGENYWGGDGTQSGSTGPFYLNDSNIQSDNKILICGNFSSYRGSLSINHIIRLQGDSSLAVNDFSKNKLSIYPNPINETLHFSLFENEIVNEYEIYDLLGKKIISNKLIENQIDVSYLSKGIYLLKLQTNEGVLNSKFIKE